MKVKWPCKFPERWKILPSKRLFPESKERAPESDEQLSATQEYGVISQAEFMRLAGRRVVQLNQNFDLRKRVEVGDFVISMRSFQGGLERAWTAGGIRSSYVVLKPRADLVLGYYQRLFKSKDYIQALQSTANFIRDGQDLNYQNFVLIDLPYPPLSEQHAIAAFLDHETARIDALIAEQERLIELLKEKRQAVISHAVTKGFDPTVPMKDSGIEWLGEVPEHWRVAKVKHVIQSFEQGWSPQCDNVPVENNEEWGVLKVGCVNGGIFSPTENKRLPNNLEPIPELFLKAGDVLISRANTRELVGSAALVDADQPNLMLSDKLFRLRATEDILPRYLVFYLGTNAVRHQIELEATGASSSMLNIGQSVIKELFIPVPSITEQQAITAQLEASLEKLYCLQKEAQLTQSLLQERRSALISAAVTGKIDVRGWKAPASDSLSPTLEAAYG